METKIQVRSFDSPLSPAEFQKVCRNPVYVILDNLRSAFNVGSIVRTADCALVEKIYFCGITAYPPHRKLDKTSLGALPYIQWEYRSSVIEPILELKREGIPIIALEVTDQSQILWKVDFPLPVALVLGNEALGVSQEALSLADGIIEIPVMGYKNSMNVAVTFGITIYHIIRQYWKQLSNTDWIQLKKIHQR